MADTSNKDRKRRIKNPETFRERTAKAAETKARAQHKSHFTTVLATSFKRLIAPPSKHLSTFFRRKPFRPIAKVLKLIGKVIFPPYFRSSWRELRLVAWPNWKESRRLTSAVLIFAIVFGAAIALVDYGLDKVFQHILLK